MGCEIWRRGRGIDVRGETAKRKAGLEGKRS
jgi:hypothetical protein